MKHKIVLVLVAGLVVLASGAAFAQSVESGNIYGKVADEQGSPLPGVTVTLAGVGPTTSTVTGATGEYRFLNLAPGTYTVAHSIQGFATVNRGNVVVNVGKNTELAIRMKLSGVAEQVTVTGEVPLLDTRRTTTGANVTQMELQSIPSARDPWVVMQTVPGVQLDRMNIGGNESGQQSVIVSKGSDVGQTVWNMDGVNITDMGSLSSPSYYDFDSFEEVQVSTGGSDVSASTPGAQLNLVTKRGTNDLHGSARVNITDHRWQADNISTELSAQLQRTGAIAATNQIQGIQDYGAEVGGPLVKDRLWLWGSYGRNQIDLITVGGATDKTTLEDINAKLNAQIVDANSATAFYSRGDKLKFGRSVGPTRPQETGWNQSGPTTVYKIEDSHIFSPNFYATVLGSYVDGGFQLVSVGRGQTFYDENAIWHNGYYDYFTGRNQTQASANASYFARTGEIGHEFKVGFTYRKTPINSLTAWTQGLWGCAAGTCQDVASVVDTRDFVSHTKQRYYSLYASDTLTISNLTVNLGLRYDNQKGNVAAISIPASRADSAIIPNNILGGETVPENTNAVTWNSIEPRIGITYAIGDQRKTLVRASYARFVSQLGGTVITYNSASPGIAGIYYPWNDANHNNHVDPGEVDTSRILNYYNVNPADPNNPAAPPNTLGNSKPPKTDEFMLGIEHEIVPTLAVSATGTYRHFTDLYLNSDATLFTYGTGLTSADYVVGDFTNGGNCGGGSPIAGHLCGTLPDGTPYDVPVYQLASGTEIPTGRTVSTRPDYTQSYKGVEVQLNKRYANGWMARASFTYNDWTQSIGAGAVIDPTDLRGGTTEDGSVVAERSTGSGNKGAVFLNSKWQTSISALYSLPLGFNVSGSFFARQGYPVAYFRVKSVAGAASAPGDNPKNVAVAPIDAYRYGTVSDLDLRLEKALTISQLHFTLGIDVFNVLNRSTVLQRQNRVGISTTNDIIEAQSARVARFTGRISF